MIVGLTGGIASGKSTVSRFFSELGIEILDADIVAKELSRKKENIEKTAEIFGKEILDENGEIKRDILRKKAFENRELLQKLNELLHPQVIEVFKRKKEEAKEDEIVIFDIPLLYEAEMDNLCDCVIVVYVSRRVQIERVMKRDRNTKELAVKIIEAQMSMREKAERGDIIINNNSTMEDLKNSVNVVYCNLQKNINER